MTDEAKAKKSKKKAKAEAPTSRDEQRVAKMKAKVARRNGR